MGVGAHTSFCGIPRGFAAQRLLADLGADESGPGPLDVLTTREREILRLVAQGLSDAPHATRLFISKRTAEHMLARSCASSACSAEARPRCSPRRCTPSPRHLR